MSVDTLLERLATAERRLAEHASRPAPRGLTPADPDSDERWEAGQVWAHLAEFPAYWLAQAESIIERAGDEPVAFGRTKTDAQRVGAIERDRHQRPDALLARVRTGIVATRRFLLSATPDRLGARGRHPTRGEMDVERLIEHFIVAHLEEHADQLDGLDRAEAPSSE